MCRYFFQSWSFPFAFLVLEDSLSVHCPESFPSFTETVSQSKSKEGNLWKGRNGEKLRQGRMPPVCPACPAYYPFCLNHHSAGILGKIANLFMFRSANSNARFLAILFCHEFQVLVCIVQQSIQNLHKRVNTLFKMLTGDWAFWIKRMSMMQ